MPSFTFSTSFHRVEEPAPSKLRTFLLGTLLLVLILCSRCIWRRIRLIWFIGRIPGPFSVPILGTTWQFEWRVDRLSNQFMHWYIEYKKKQVDLFRIWVGPIPVVAPFSIEAVKEILESQEVISKGVEYGIIRRWLGNGLLISTGDKWRCRRKLLTPAFHFKILQKFHSVHDREARIFIEQLVPFSDTGRPVDLFPFLKRLALDIICETSMGVKVNAQTNHKHPYVIAITHLNRLAFTYIRMPWLWIKPLWYFLGYGCDFDEKLQMVTDFTRQVIDDRRKTFNPAEFDDQADHSPRRGYVFLDQLLSLESRGEINAQDVREEVDTFMFEGHDTTSSALAWTIWCLACNLDAQQKVWDEVDRIFGETDRQCTADDLKEMRYVEQCIKEALRLYPPVPLYSRRVEKDFKCLDYTIPRGTTLLVIPSFLHLCKKIYPDPHIFNPDRFNADSTSPPFAFIPFSAGPRNCIGQKFALMELKTVIALVFRHYKVTTRTRFGHNRPCFEMTNRPHLGVPVVLESRRPPSDGL